MTKYEYTVLPEYSPLYPKLPYIYKDYQKVSVFCRGDKETLQKFLPKEFQLTSDIFEVFILQNNEIEGLDPYSEGGIVIPCSFDGIQGACVAFEYVDTDDALCAGREIWGYPKKMAKVNFTSTENSVKGSIERKGKKIIDLEFKVDEDKKFDSPNLSPRLQVKRMPHPERYGTEINDVIKNELQNTVIKKTSYGYADLTMEESEEDPLVLLRIKEIIGAKYIEGGFTLTYGEIIKKLEEP